MEDYKPNSFKSKEKPEKKVEKVVSGEVKRKTKNEVQKFADVFISEDAGNVKNYILMEVLVPAIKKAVSDIVTNGIDMILYGETGRSKTKTPGSRVSYGNYYDDSRDSRRRVDVRNRNGYSYDNITIDSRGEAEEVLMNLEELIEVYGIASVADFYELVGVTGAYTDNKYGWTDLRNASVVRVRDGYMLKLPRAMPIN